MKQPYLIQRGIINKTVVQSHTLSKAVSLEYMGSAEFEFGALPTSLKAMRTNKENLKLYIISSIKNNKQPLFLYGAISDSEKEQYINWLNSIRQKNDRIVRLKERANFEIPLQETNFWWDLDNNIMFSFNEQFMRTLPGYLQNSWNVMK